MNYTVYLHNRFTGKLWLWHCYETLSKAQRQCELLDSVDDTDSLDLYVEQQVNGSHQNRTWHKYECVEVSTDYGPKYERQWRVSEPPDRVGCAGP